MPTSDDEKMEYKFQNLQGVYHYTTIKNENFKKTLQVIQNFVII